MSFQWPHPAYCTCFIVDAPALLFHHLHRLTSVYVCQLAQCSLCVHVISNTVHTSMIQSTPMFCPVCDSMCCMWLIHAIILQTRDDFLGLVEIPLEHALISTEHPHRTLHPRDFILRPRRFVVILNPACILLLTYQGCCSLPFSPSMPWDAISTLASTETKADSNSESLCCTPFLNSKPYHASNVSCHKYRPAKPPYFVKGDFKEIERFYIVIDIKCFEQDSKLWTLSVVARRITFWMLNCQSRSTTCYVDSHQFSLQSQGGIAVWLVRPTVVHLEQKWRVCVLWVLFSSLSLCHMGVSIFVMHAWWCHQTEERMSA